MSADPTTWGWQDEGWVTPSLQDILDYVHGRAEVRTGKSIPRTSASPAWLVLAAAGDGLEQLAGLGRGIVDAFDRANASGEALDAYAHRVGTDRLSAEPSTATVRLTGTAGTIVPSGSLVSDTLATARFELGEAATIGAGGTVDVLVSCTEDGPVAPGNISVVVTPVSGWTSVALAPDETVSPGRLEETDAELRLRLTVADFARGKGTPKAIRAAVLEVAGVLHCRVFVNATEATVSDRPPYSREVVIAPSVDDTLIAPVIIDQETGGARSYGTSSAATTDANGESRTAYWTVATPVDIDVTVVATTDSTAPDDWDTQVAAAIEAYIDGLTIGDTVRYFKVVAAVASVPGIVTATITMRRDAEAYASADIAIDEREIPTTVGATISVS